MIATVTAYCACAACCGREGGLTASGSKPVVGITIAAPRSIPLGTKVYVHLPSGWKTFTVQDRTAPRYEGRFDIFMPSHSAARRFGIQRLKVRIGSLAGTQTPVSDNPGWEALPTPLQLPRQNPRAKALDVLEALVRPGNRSVVRRQRLLPEQDVAGERVPSCRDSVQVFLRPV